MKRLKSPGGSKNYAPHLFCCLFFLSAYVSTYFKTPNDVNKMPTTVYLDDGTSGTGYLTIQFEQGIAIEKYITLFHKDAKEPEKLNAELIKYYTVNNNYYVPRKIDLNLSCVDFLLFVKRLSRESSKIQFYELEQEYKSTPTGSDRKLYFISLPGQSKFEVWST